MSSVVFIVVVVYSMSLDIALVWTSALNLTNIVPNMLASRSTGSQTRVRVSRHVTTILRDSAEATAWSHTLLRREGPFDAKLFYRIAVVGST